MSFLHKFLKVFVVQSLLSSCSSALDPDYPQVSLWGKVADFTFGCSHLSPKPHVSIPALQEFTVCLNLKLKYPSPWTAFMYRPAEGQWAELSLGAKSGRIVVWLLGTEWRTSPMVLPLGQWHSFCLTWSHTTNRPNLYVNGNMLDITSADVDSFPLMPPSCCQLAPNGTLTLGAAHFLANGKLQIISLNRLKGQVSLFRMWGRARSDQEVMSLYCTEGDLVKWEDDSWETETCPTMDDLTLQCDWSIYEVKLSFLIFRFDGNNTELYTARDIAHRWLRDVLPGQMYLHRVSVFEGTRINTEDSLEEIFHDDHLELRAEPNVNKFDCLVHLNVIPSLHVASVQNKLHKDLQEHYKTLSGLLLLMADPDSIHITPIETFPTVGPPDVVTELSTVTTPTIKTTTSPSTSSPTTTSKPTDAITTISTSTVSSTTTPFTEATGNASDVYFEVKVNVSITGEGDPAQSLSIWLNTSLPNDEMLVLNFQLLPKTPKLHPNLQSNLSVSEGGSSYRRTRESCVFQVEVLTSPSDARDVEERIRYLLELPYNSSSVTVATQDIQISRILILKCKSHTHQTRKGLFQWPATSGQKNATLPCPGNRYRHATRHCKLCLSTHWIPPDLEDCPLVVKTIPDLDHVDVTTENAGDVVEMIQSLLNDHSTLSYQELVTVLNKLKAIIQLSVVTPSLGRALINIISDILESDSDLMPFTNTILKITESVGDKMLGYEDSFTLVAPAIAVSVVDVLPGQFSSLTFGVSSIQGGLKPEIFINTDPFSGTVAFISLPSALQHSFPQHSPGHRPPRVQFQFYGIPMLFKGSQNGPILNTFVVSASVTNASSPIKDLTEDVKVTLHHLTPNTLNKEVQCVYWNFNKNNGHGGWDDYGCRKHNSSSNYTTCLCDHLTHFGVLLDVSRTPVDPANEQTLTIITYVGCGVSSLFLGITALTYTAFEKLRRDYPSQILINLSLALLGLNLNVLVNSWLSSWGLYGLCVAAAATLHYFLLASFTWMGLEAVNMYFALVKVFNVYVPSYILKFCALGWGIPLLICVLVLVVNRDAYGSHIYTVTQSRIEPLDHSEDFCWIQDYVAFYVSVVGYAVLVFLFNTAIFVVVLIQIRHMRANRPAGIRSGLMHDLKGVASLTLLLGLTWALGFFTWGPARVPLLYLFSTLNTLQGLFIFLFHCLMKENVRKQWRIHLCVGRFRLEEHSEWSHTASVGGAGKPRSNPPIPPVPSVRSIKSSSTDSTSASSDSSHRDSFSRRPNLGLFVNVLALPRAQRRSSLTGASPSQRAMNPGPGWMNHMLDQQGHK